MRSSQSCFCILAALLAVASRSFQSQHLFAGRFAGGNGRGMGQPSLRGKVGQPALGADDQLTQGTQRLWHEVSMGPDLEPESDAVVLPVFPSSAVLWPNNTVRLGVMEPAHEKMYHDMLMSGSRYVVAPLARLGSSPDCSEDASADSLPQSCLLQSTAAVLRLEELEDRRQQGHPLQYVAKHVVNMRASIRRVLNPSALFVSSRDEMRNDYLRVEVDLYPEKFDDPASGAAANNEETLKELCDTFSSLRNLSMELEEPPVPEVCVDMASVQQFSSWQLAELWYQTRLRQLEHRERQRVKLAVNEWLHVQKMQGNAYADPSSAIEAMPDYLRTEVARVNQEDGRVAPSVADLDFYEPFLKLLASPTPEERNELLVGFAAAELKQTQARASIRNVLQ